MSMRWRIFGAFSIIIIVTVLLSSIAAYYVAITEFEPLYDELNLNEQRVLSKKIGEKYSALNDWPKTIDVMRSELSGGFWFDQDFMIIDDGSLVSASETEFDLMGEQEFEQFGSDAAYIGAGDIEEVSQRVVVLDAQRKVVFDSNDDNLEFGAGNYKTTKAMTSIHASPDSRVVGYVSITSDFSLWQSGALSFVGSTLFTLLIGGVLTMAIALLLAFWFAKRITAPVHALTRATRDLANNHSADLLLVKSDDELGEMTRAFNKMARSLRLQREVRTRLIHDISHELNTPLSIIALESSGMKDNMQSPEEAANQILHEVSMLKNLVNDLSWLVETDAEELNYNFNNHAFLALVRSEVNRFRSAVDAKGLSLTVDELGVDETTMVRIDATRISQAIGNLFTNSIEHTESGGIKLLVSLTDVNSVLFTLSDTGKGISAEHLPHVENRLYRIDKARTRDSGNRGLGLAITASIINAHDGKFSIRSLGDGLGTTTTIELPILV